jgi:4-oxalocrotonate tautomerase
MPHVIVKLWPGRTDEQKRKLTERIIQAVGEELGAGEKSVSVAFEEIPSNRWVEEVYEPEIAGKSHLLTKEPGYKPEDLK